MMCPLQTAGMCANPQQEEPIGCDKENCAWWDQGWEKCAVLILAEGVRRIEELAQKQVR